jgi:UDP-N-acetylglucosamine 4,6-dehydratase
VRFFVGDVRDRDRLYRAFEGIDVVVHAAALKQIPSCEYNPFEAVKTNIYGAQNVIDAAIDRNVNKVVALSTDKACQPINLYGATKLCSDKLFIAGNSYVGNRDTRFAVVRYGNVAGSRGSVIPYFRKLIKDGAGELPVTDKRMTRFWLKLEEAVELVLKAIETMYGGELYVRKLPSMKVVDLAKAMAPELKIAEVGLRPGEKIHEKMISREDAPYTLEYQDYFIIQPQFKWWTRTNHKQGKPVASDFEYDSSANNDWLTVPQMKKLVKNLKFAEL